MAIRIVDDPLLKKEWDYEKNVDDIETITSGSGKQIWWKCPIGHSYQATPANRVNAKSGCPYCRNKKVLAGYNDLATTRPELLFLWNNEKNTIKPSELTAVSGKKVWWRCPKGHEWESTVAHIAYGRGCPTCSSEASSSFPEQSINYYLSQIDNTVRSRYKVDNKYEIDIYLPSRNIGIEYDGYRWHRSQKKKQLDAKKEAYFSDKNIRIIRIIEVVKKEKIIDGFIKDNGRYYYNNDNIPVLNMIIEDLIKDIYGTNINVDISKDRITIYNNYLLTEKKNNVEDDPSLCELWDKEKNGNISPAYVKRYSDKKVWWRCKEKNHSFLASPHAMSFGLTCPYCSKEEIEKNSLSAKYPEIAKEWNYEKNAPLTPNDVLPGSNKKVWWKCPNGHDWLGKIETRTREYGFCNCPVCSERKIIPGINDLFTTNPALKSEWLFEKNKTIDPSQIGAGCIKKAWWKCSKCGYEWQTQIRLRTRTGCGCNQCSSKRAGEKYRQYVLSHGGIKVSSRKDLMKMWDFDKNVNVNPDEITIGTAKKVWWKCNNGHPSFESSVCNVSKGHGCKICGIEKRRLSRMKNKKSIQ